MLSIVNAFCDILVKIFYICLLYIILFNRKYLINLLDIMVIIINPKYVYEITKPTEYQYLMAFCLMDDNQNRQLFKHIQNPTENLCIKLLRQKNITSYDFYYCIEYKNFITHPLIFLILVLIDKLFPNFVTFGNTMNTFITGNYDKINISNKLKWIFLNNNINYIKYIKDPTEEMCTYVLKQDPCYIKYIKNKTETIYLGFIEGYETVYHKKNSDGVRYVYPITIYYKYIDKWTLAMINSLNNLSCVMTWKKLPENYKKYIWSKDTHNFLCKYNRQIVETIIICNKQLGLYKIPLCVLSSVISNIV